MISMQVYGQSPTFLCLYIFSDIVEKPNFACSFKKSCGCGYRYLSGNVRDVWVQQPIFTQLVVNNTGGNDTEDDGYRLHGG